MKGLQEIFALFTERGSQAYFGEPVSQLEHALQAAAQAKEAGASEPEIVAALLHDLGHLLHGREETIADAGIDAGHEAVGERWLERHFPPAITRPVLLNVAAKRYLCATEEHYLEGLSPASRRSLTLQGGPMSQDECQRFQMLAEWQSAVRLRRWDDKAKIPGLVVPSLESYRPLLARWLVA